MKNNYHYMMRQMRGTQWTPLEESSVEAWYEARLISSPPAEAGALSSWEDESGNGRTMGEGDAAKYYSKTAARIINSQPVVKFDGTADFYTATDFAYTNNVGLYCFAVIRAGDFATGGRIISHWEETGDQRAFYFGQQVDEKLGISIVDDGTTPDGTNSKVGTADTALTPGAKYLVEFHMDFIGNSLSLVVNGVTQAKTMGNDANISSVHNSTSPLRLAAESAAGAQNFFNSDIAAICFGTKVLPVGTLTDFRNYFNNHYHLF